MGITADETDRMLAIKRNWKETGNEARAILAEKGLDKDGALDLLQTEYGLTLPNIYRRGDSHLNCKPCVKGGHLEIARILYYRDPLPRLMKSRAFGVQTAFEFNETMELLHQQVFNHSHTIMRDRKTIKGKTVSFSLTLRDFRLRMETRWKQMLPGIDPFEALEGVGACYFCNSV